MKYQNNVHFLWIQAFKNCSQVGGYKQYIFPDRVIHYWSLKIPCCINNFLYPNLGFPLITQKWYK